MKTTSDKIDELLGLSEDTTSEDLVSKMIDDNSQIHEAFDQMKDKLSCEFDIVEQNIKNIKSNENPVLEIASIDHAMKKIERLIDLSEEMFEHIHENFCASDLIDSELLHAAAAFMESLHINISEFVSLYKDKQKFVEKVKLMVFSQKQKIEMMEKKQQMAIELMEKKAKLSESTNAVDVTGGFAGMPDQESIVKMLATMANNELTTTVNSDTKDNNLKQ